MRSQFFETTKKWSVYDDGDYDFLQRHFVHQNLLKFSLQCTSAKGRMQVEEGFNVNQKKSLNSSGEVKFQFPLSSSDKLIYSRITSEGKFLFSYDNGMLKLTSGSKLNFFSSFQTTRNFKDSVYKFGLACLGENYNYAFRCRYHQGEDSGDMLLHAKGSNKGEWSNGNWRFNFYSIFSPAITKFIKSGLLFGVDNTKSNDSFFLRIESGKKAKDGVQLHDLFRVFKLNWNRTVNPELKVGFETKIDFHNWQHLWSHTFLGAQWKFAQEKVFVKAKVSPNLTTAVSVNREIGDYGDYSIGMEIKELGKANNVKFGAKIRLNI